MEKLGDYMEKIQWFSSILEPIQNKKRTRKALRWKALRALPGIRLEYLRQKQDTQFCIWMKNQQKNERLQA